METASSRSADQTTALNPPMPTSQTSQRIQHHRMGHGPPAGGARVTRTAEARARRPPPGGARVARLTLRAGPRATSGRSPCRTARRAQTTHHNRPKHGPGGRQRAEPLSCFPLSARARRPPVGEAHVVRLETNGRQRPRPSLSRSLSGRGGARTRRPPTGRARVARGEEPSRTASAGEASTRTATGDAIQIPIRSRDRSRSGKYCSKKNRSSRDLRRAELEPAKRAEGGAGRLPNQPRREEQRPPIGDALHRDRG